jgi:hypothetical protein
MATGAPKQRTSGKTCGLLAAKWLQLRATFNRQLKECRDGERFEEFAGSMREKFYRRRRLGGIVTATLRIPNGTTCPVTRLENPP